MLTGVVYSVECGHGADAGRAVGVAVWIEEAEASVCEALSGADRRVTSGRRPIQTDHIPGEDFSQTVRANLQWIKCQLAVMMVNWDRREHQ